MPEQLHYAQIDAMTAVEAVSATLRRIDERLIDHGERVAFIACAYCERVKAKLDRKTLFLLSIFHDIGAYKTEEIDRMVEFETHDVQNHAVYGYLFLKYLTPLHQYAEAILYHHTPWQELEAKNIAADCKEYATLIHLADRIDIALHYDAGDWYLEKLFADAQHMFRADMLAEMQECMREQAISESLADGSYRTHNLARCREFLSSTAETLEYLKMVVYSIDYRSEHTVTHTVNTSSIALDIARHFGLSEEEQEKVYLGALLHDVGKIAIPLDVLEHPGKLNAEKMAVMCTHVSLTEELIRGIVPDDICEIAVRHHEKLDGSGYPKGLTAEALTFSQRMVAVADVVSALGSRRSYKEPFPKERTVSILKQMSASQLDSEICSYICNNYEDIMTRTDGSRQWVVKQYQSIMCEYEAAREALREYSSSKPILKA